jgi:hypothetical protein
MYFVQMSRSLRVRLPGQSVPVSTDYGWRGQLWPKYGQYATRWFQSQGECNAGKYVASMRRSSSTGARENRAQCAPRAAHRAQWARTAENGEGVPAPGRLQGEAVCYEFPRGQCDAMLVHPRRGIAPDALVSHFLRRCCTVTTRNAKLFLLIFWRRARRGRAMRASYLTSQKVSFRNSLRSRAFFRCGQHSMSEIGC